MIATPRPPRPVTRTVDRRRYVATTTGTAHLHGRGSMAVCGADSADWRDVTAAEAGGMALCHDCRALRARVPEARLARWAEPCPRCRAGANQTRGGSPWAPMCRIGVRVQDLATAAYSRFLRFSTPETFIAQRRAQAALYSHLGRSLPPLNDHEVAIMMDLDPLFAARVAASVGCAA